MRTTPFLLAFALLTASACASGTAYDDGVVSTPETRYRIASPGDGFERVDVEDQNDLAWVGPSGTTIQVNSSCGAPYDIPLVALTNHLLFGFTERGWDPAPYAALTVVAEALCVLLWASAFVRWPGPLTYRSRFAG